MSENIKRVFGRGVRRSDKGLYYNRGGVTGSRVVPSSRLSLCKPVILASGQTFGLIQKTIQYTYPCDALPLRTKLIPSLLTMV